MTSFPYSESNKYIQWSWKNFEPLEFACKCCGHIKFDKNVVDAWDKLQTFRKLVDAPVVINSAYRCPVHNKAVGGAKSSYHLKGVAFDIRITSSLPRHVIHEQARKAGFTGFGDYKTFVHIDTGRKRSWKG